MPSGAKKRKAAKKKKEKQPHLVQSSTDNNNNFQHHSGAEEVKSQDERDSDGGETASPDSQEQNAFRNWNEDAEKKGMAVQSLDGEDKSVEDVSLRDIQEGRQGDGEVVEVVRVMESKEGSESKDPGVEHDKAAEELYDGNNGSVRFADDEPQVAEKKLEEEHIAATSVCKSDSASKELIGITEEYIGESEVAEKKSKEEHGTAISVLEPAPSDNSFDPVNAISKEVTGVTEYIESQVAKKYPEGENISVNSVLEIAPSDGTLELNDSISNEATGVAEKAPMEETSGSFLVTSNIVDSIKQVDSASKEVVAVQESAQFEDPSVNPSELKSEETRDNILSNTNEISGNSLATKTEDKVFLLSDVNDQALLANKIEVSGDSLAMKTENNMFSNTNEVLGDSLAMDTEDKDLPLSDVNVQASSTTVVPATGNETALSSIAPEADTKGEDDGKECDITKCSRNQPFISSVPPQAVAKTSWLSCCGLFDVFSGSNR